jgi:hypothetical protein
MLVRQLGVTARGVRDEKFEIPRSLCMIACGGPWLYMLMLHISFRSNCISVGSGR